MAQRDHNHFKDSKKGENEVKMLKINLCMKI